MRASAPMTCSKLDICLRLAYLAEALSAEVLSPKAGLKGIDAGLACESLQIGIYAAVDGIFELLTKTFTRCVHADCSADSESHLDKADASVSKCTLMQYVRVYFIS